MTKATRTYQRCGETLIYRQNPLFYSLSASPHPRPRKWGVERSERPQPLICEWIVDFDCFAARLVIEVDGDVHDRQRAEDERRTHALQFEGLEVLRAQTGEGFDVTVDSSGNKVFP